MKIKAKVKIKTGYNLDCEIDAIKFKVTFKEPNKFRRVKLQDCIIAHKWRQKETKTEFMERCNVFLSDQNEMVRVVKEMVNEYFEKKEITSNSDVLEDGVRASIKAFNKKDFEIEVEI